MANITTARQNYKNTESTSDVYCVRLVTGSGTILRYSSSIDDLEMTEKVVDGVVQAIGSTVTYLSSTGFDLSAVTTSTEESGNIDLMGVLEPLGVSRESIIQGAFSNARIYVFMTNQNDPIEDEEKVFSGFWGETTFRDGKYTTKFKGLLDVFNFETGRVFTQNCDARLGSGRCGVDLENSSVWAPSTSYTYAEGDARLQQRISDPSYTHVDYGPIEFVTSGLPLQSAVNQNGTGTSGASFFTTLPSTLDLDIYTYFTDNEIEWRIIMPYETTRTLDATPAGSSYFAYETPYNLDYRDQHFYDGSLEFVGGSYDGVKFRIVKHDVSGVYLSTALLEAIPQSQQVILRVGCQKSIATCGTKFDNTKNFQGFPHMPGRKNIQKRGLK